MDKFRNRYLKILVGIVGVTCIIAFLLIRNSINTKTFDDFIGMPNPNISKIVMFNGSNGKSVFTTDIVKIQKLVSLLNNRSYYKSSYHGITDGCGGYSYTFYVDNKKVLEMGDSGGSVNIYGTNYSTNIIPNEGMENWYKSLISDETVTQDFINNLYDVGIQKVADYKELIKVSSSPGSLDIISSKGTIKADKTLHVKYLKLLQTFDRRIQPLMTKEAYERVISNRYNTISSEICEKGNYIVRVKDFILYKNVYGNMEDKAGYNYDVKLQFISYYWKTGKIYSTKGYVGFSKGYIGLSKVNDQWKVSDYKLTVAPNSDQETLMKTQKK